MNSTWHKTAGFAAMMAVVALLVGSNFFSQDEGKFHHQYVEEKLQNDSLMGAVQDLQKQLWEKEQELGAKNSLIDSITHACTTPDTGSDTDQ